MPTIIEGLYEEITNELLYNFCVVDQQILQLCV